MCIVVIIIVGVIIIIVNIIVYYYYNYCYYYYLLLLGVLLLGVLSFVSMNLMPVLTKSGLSLDWLDPDTNLYFERVEHLNITSYQQQHCKPMKKHGYDLTVVHKKVHLTAFMTGFAI